MCTPFDEEQSSNVTQAVGTASKVLFMSPGSTISDDCPIPLISQPTMSTHDQTTVAAYYWNVNRPQEEWTEECPEPLKDMSAKDIGIISTKDEDCHQFSWEEVKTVASKENLPSSGGAVRQG